MVKKKKSNFAGRLKTPVRYILLGLYKVTFGFYISHKFKLRLSPGSTVPVRGPYLLLFNHCNNLDGFFLQQILPRPVSYLITDTLYRKKSIRALFWLADYIPKKKFVSDSRSIRKIVRVIERGGIVGLSAEGARSWDGSPLPVLEATYKLAKLLKVPVITAKIKGGYFSEPRWAETKRRGIVEVEMKTALEKEDILKMSVQEIGKVIAEAIWQDETAWQREVMIPFRGKDLAAGFERLLYICPQCYKMNSIASDGNEFYCKECEARYCFDDFGFIHPIKGALPSDNAAGLNAWQRGLLYTKIADTNQDNEIFSEEDSHLLESASDTAPFEEVDKGRLVLTHNRLSLGGTSFNTTDIYGLQVYFKSDLAFRYKSCDYRISFNGRASAYKWRSALALLNDYNTKEDK